VTAYRVVAGGWFVGEFGGQCNWTETLRGSRNSNLCDRHRRTLTCSKWGERKESVRLINGNLKQSNRRGKS
jgi:hypothetical protein